jgi:transposase
MPPWKITDLSLSVENRRLDITIEWPADRRVICPECGKMVGIKDHRAERIWRHLDTMQFHTFLHCRVPRSECPDHGARTVAVPWSEAGSRWTLLFEAFAIEVMLQVPSINKAREILQLSWDEAHAMRARAVRRGLASREIEGGDYLGLDEKSFGRRERFVTVLTDLTNERVLEVTASKSTVAAMAALAVIPADARASIPAVAMDMAASYEKACGIMLPAAEIVYDKFHIEKLLSTAMDRVRRKEHNRLKAAGVPVFTKSRYLFLRRPERWSEAQHEQFRNITEEYGEKRFSASRIGRAWAIKEAFRHLWTYIYPGAATRFFRKWYFWATHSRLRPVIEAARTMDRHLEGIIAYFRHGITNAFTESMNARIQEIKSAARGFRNFQNYRIAILFYCGKLELKPQ